MRTFLCLIVMVSACYAPAMAQTATKPADKNLEALRQSVQHQRWVALAWARTGYFDEAREALRHADRDYRALVALRGNGPPSPSFPTWNLDRELAKIDGYEQSRNLLIEKFDLPERSLGFIDAGPYMKSSREPVDDGLWFVMYTVGPKSLTKKQIAVDPGQYYPAAPIEGARSYIATYKPVHPDNGDAPTDWKRIAQVELPDGRLPDTVRRNYSGLLLVRTHQGGTRQGFILLDKGKVVQLKGGPCAGPARVPRPNADWMLLEWQYGGHGLTVFKAGRKQDVMCHYVRNSLRRVVTISNGDVVKIEEVDNRGETELQTVFDASAIKGDRLSFETVKMLGRQYTILKMRRPQNAGAVPPITSGEPEIEYDTKKQQWRLLYEWGTPEIRGGSRRIVLDKNGALVSFSHHLIRR